LDKEKLYSPIFCTYWDDKDSMHDYPYYFNQNEAAAFRNEIHAAILKERSKGEEKRGLMTYYHADDSVDRKVKSLVVDVEVHGGKLWTAAELEIAEPLTGDEYDALKDFLENQYSDGFGEGFAQRYIKTEEGEIKVSTWKFGDEFFIDNQAEFAARTGFAYLAPDNLQTAAAEIGELHAQLLERADKNWNDYRHLPHNTTPDNLYRVSATVIAHRDAHIYLNKYKGFDAEQLKCLL